MIGKMAYDWMDRDRILAEFGKTERKAVEGIPAIHPEG